MALAIFIGLLVALFLAKKKNISVDDIYDLIFWLIISGFLGARLYQIFILDADYYFQYPAEMIKVWHGGLAIHGGIIGGIAGLIIWSKVRKKSFLSYIDLAAVILPLGQAIGRFGNYFNQELFGRPSDSPLAIFIAYENRPSAYKAFSYFQPAFLYESALDLILFFILSFIYLKKKLKPGEVAVIYIFGYSSIRFLMEFIRIDETLYIFGFRWPQVLSLLLMLISLGIFLRIRGFSWKLGRK